MHLRLLLDLVELPESAELACELTKTSADAIELQWDGSVAARYPASFLREFAPGGAAFTSYVAPEVSAVSPGFSDVQAPAGVAEMTGSGFFALGDGQLLCRWGDHPPVAASLAWNLSLVRSPNARMTVRKASSRGQEDRDPTCFWMVRPRYDSCAATCPL